jgi:hypothetical protein
MAMLLARSTCGNYGAAPYPDRADPLPLQTISRKAFSGVQRIAFAP